MSSSAAPFFSIVKLYLMLKQIKECALKMLHFLEKSAIIYLNLINSLSQ